MYQGTTLVVPDSSIERLGFTPLCIKGLKPLIPAVTVGTTEVVP